MKDSLLKIWNTNIFIVKMMIRFVKRNAGGCRRIKILFSYSPTSNFPQQHFPVYIFLFFFLSCKHLHHILHLDDILEHSSCYCNNGIDTNFEIQITEIFLMLWWLPRGHLGRSLRLPRIDSNRRYLNLLLLNPKKIIYPHSI